MAEPRSPLKEFRHLDEKLQTVGLSAAERARWESLRALVSPGAGAPDAPGPAVGGFDVEAAAAALRASLVPAGMGRAFAAAQPETGGFAPGPWEPARANEAGRDPGRDPSAPQQPEAWAEVQPGEESWPAAEAWAEPGQQAGDPWQAGPVPQEGAVAWDPNAAPPLDANWAQPAVESWPPEAVSPKGGAPATGHYDAAAWDDGAAPRGAWDPGSQPGAGGGAAAWSPDAGGAAAWDPSAAQDAGAPPAEPAGWEAAVAGQDLSLWADAPPQPAEDPPPVGGEYDAQAEPSPGSPDLDPSRWPQDEAGALFQATPAELAAWEAAATEQAATQDQAAASGHGRGALDASSLPLVEEVSLEEITLEELDVEPEAPEVSGEPLPGAEMLGEVSAAGAGVAPLDPLGLGPPVAEPLASPEIDAGALAPDDLVGGPPTPETGGLAIEPVQPLEFEPAPIGGPGQEVWAPAGDAGPPPMADDDAGAPLELSSAAEFLALVGGAPEGGVPFEAGALDLPDVPEVTADDIEEIVDELVEVPEATAPGEASPAALAGPDVVPPEPPSPVPPAGEAPQAVEPWVVTGPAWAEPPGPPAAPTDLATATLLPGAAEVVALEELMVTPPPRGAEALAPPLPPSPALAVEQEPVAVPAPAVAPPLIVPRGPAAAPPPEPWNVPPAPEPFALAEPTPAPPAPIAAAAAAPAPPVEAPAPPPEEVAEPAPEEVPAAGPASVVSPTFVSGEHRVVVHTVEGQVLRGSLADADLVGAEVPLLQAGGELLHVPASRAKAVFFMLAPGEKPPAALGTKVRVVFSDGRQVAGMSPDYAPGAPGFFLVPLDSRTNTGRIWIYRDATRQISVG